MFNVYDIFSMFYFNVSMYVLYVFSYVMHQISSVFKVHSFAVTKKLNKYVLNLVVN